jgi:Uncharacterized conserved protein
MSRFALRGARARDADDRPRVGLFGHLGSGNIGNDASLEAMLTYFSSEQPGTILDAMTLAPEAVKDRYGVPAARCAGCRPTRARARAARWHGSPW